MQKVQTQLPQSLKDFIAFKYDKAEKVKEEKLITFIANHMIQKRHLPSDEKHCLMKQYDECQQICKHSSGYKSGSVVLVAGVAGTGKTSIFKTMAIKNSSITFIHIKVGELIIITKSGKESTDLLFEIAEFYQPSVIVFDQFQLLYDGYPLLLQKLLAAFSRMEQQNIKVPIFMISNNLKKYDKDKTPKICKSVFVGAPSYIDRIKILKHLCRQENFKPPMNYPRIAEKLNEYTMNDLIIIVKDAAFNQARKMIQKYKGNHEKIALHEIEKMEVNPQEIDIIEVLMKTKRSFSLKDQEQFYKDFITFKK